MVIYRAGTETQVLTVVLQQLFLQLWQGQPVLRRAAAVIIKTHLVQLQGQKRHSTHFVKQAGELLGTIIIRASISLGWCANALCLNTNKKS